MQKDFAVIPAGTEKKYMGAITLDERERLTVTGVKKAESLTAAEVFLYTENGDLIIKGSGLESEELDPAKGVFRLKGRIDQLRFTTEKYHLPDNIISRLLK